MAKTGIGWSHYIFKFSAISGPSSAETADLAKQCRKQIFEIEFSAPLMQKLRPVRPTIQKLRPFMRRRFLAIFGKLQVTRH